MILTKATGTKSKQQEEEHTQKNKEKHMMKESTVKIPQSVPFF